MELRQALYNIKKGLIEKKTPKIKLDSSQKVIVVEGCASEKFSALFPNNVVVNTIDVISRDDYDKIIVYMGSPQKEKLKLMESLQWLQLSSAGLNGYDKNELYDTKPIITTAKGIYGLPIAECVIGDILFLMKPALSNTIAKKYSIPALDGLEFTNSKVLICGLGDIGRNIAARCKGMRCDTVIGLDTYHPEDENIDEVYPLSDLPNIIGNADVVISAVPDLPETRQMFNEKIFSKMKKNAIFVNVGRGTAVCQNALFKAIKSKHLFGAALDVTTPDPLPRMHKIRKNNRILVTDHLACISRNNTERLQKFYMEQIQKYLRGEVQ